MPWQDGTVPSLVKTSGLQGNKNTHNNTTEDTDKCLHDSSVGYIVSIIQRWIPGHLHPDGCYPLVLHYAACHCWSASGSSCYCRADVKIEDSDSDFWFCSPVSLFFQKLCGKNRNCNKTIGKQSQGQAATRKTWHGLTIGSSSFSLAEETSESLMGSRQEDIKQACVNY